LRRPFSVYRVNANIVEVMFQVLGQGTHVLSCRNVGDFVDVIGPLGRGFRTTGLQCETAVLIAGGLGVAPMPLLARQLASEGKNVVTILGARTSSALIETDLLDVRAATDDSSRGFHGNSVDCARSVLEEFRPGTVEVFACGPTPMLRAVKKLAEEKGLNAQLSLEGPMGCGFGICQGCPVEMSGGEKRYSLMCKDGPVFDASAIVL
jgi:dihydroorotate dehydrogenase electron transfer subunit